MLPHHNTIATAAEVAARLPGTRRDGQAYRTRGYCHGSGDKPTSASLKFSDPDKPGYSLNVRCFSCNPSTPAEYDAIRHALQKATNGLHLCRCRTCWEARRTGRPPTRPTARPAAASPRPQPETTQPDTRRYPDAVNARQWGTHQLPQDDTATRSHTSACPLCQQPDALIAWTLADHPFPYAGLSLQCQCPASYDQLHKHIASQVAAKGRQWRQDAIYILENGQPRARTRTDPDKRIFWSGQKASVKGRQPLCWNHRRRGQPPDAPRVLLVEGEKAAAAAVSASIDGSHAVYSVGDAAGFRITDFTPFTGREITLWPDADPAGIAGTATAARRLAPLARRIALVATDDIPNKGDAADVNPRTIHAKIQSAKEIAE